MSQRLSTVMIVAVDIRPDMTVGDLVVGAGTLALAVFTLWLAISTRQSARAAERAVDAAGMPFVLPTPVPPDQPSAGPSITAQHLWDDLMQALTPVEIRKVLHGGRDQVLIRLWNVGAGPAVVRDVRLRAAAQNADWTEMPPREIPVGAGQAADTHIPVTTWHDEVRLALTVHYLHSNGREYATLCDAAIRGDMLVCRSYRRIEATGRDVARTRQHPVL